MLGARLTGGGFGGSIVAIAERRQRAAAAARIVAEYAPTCIAAPAAVLIPIKPAARNLDTFRLAVYMNIVCVSHLRWDFVFQRPQHLLSRARKDGTVLYVEEPVSCDGRRASR